MRTILQKTKTEKSIRNVYIVAFVLLLLSYLITVYSNRELVRQANLVQHTNDVIKNLDNVLANVRDAETGSRGYIMTQDIRFLFPYYGTAHRIDSLYNVLFGLLSDNPVQTERLGSLKESITKRFGLLAFGLKSFEENNRQRSDTMRKLQPEAIRTMDSVRLKISIMQREEQRMLTSRTSKMQQTFRTIDIITFISLVVAFSLIIFGFFSYMRVSKARKKAQEEVEEYQERLNTRINELDEANSELLRMRSQEKFAATGRIARTIAHEVRNPLTNINLATDQLKTEALPQDENTGFLFDMINRNSNRINQLISDLLNSTKFSELNYQKLSINEFIEETLKEAEDRMALGNVTLIKKMNTGNCTISVDRAKMKIALLNIIINAVEAMEGTERKQLTIETRTRDNHCEIVISDTGAGMDAESLSKLFEPYFTSKPKGNGLGLTNTQNIVLNHNGDISVKSLKNQGTTFTITLGLAG